MPKRRRSRSQPTRAQKAIAALYGIPVRLAKTINLKKAREYQKWLHRPVIRLERFLDGMEAARRAMLGQSDPGSIE